MPGLIRGVARTAVIAGTATAVSGRVARRQAEKYTDRDAQIAADRQAAYEQATAPAAAPVAAAPAAAAPEVDLMDQLQKLGDLKAQGILTEEEFAAQKAKLLGT
ncbi:MAG: SHOCT domain-containing protein [Actinomycetes bacterium]